MLRANEDGRMLFIHNEFLLYNVKCKWNRATGQIWTKFLTLFNTIARSTCCNVSINIMKTQQKYRIANILNSRTFFLQIW